MAGRSAAEARISVVIPARNEEHNLARLLPSLLQNGSPPHEVIVVNDQSEDATGAVAKGNGAKVLNGKSLPEGWYGKPWACQQGADAATGDWLLFLDADTVMESGGLARIHGLTRYDQAVHSICPHHRVEKPYEQLSAFFNVVMILGMNAFTLMGFQAKSIGLFGQALLISRPQYDSVEGHRPVKREVLENFHLSRHLARVGYQCRCYLGKGTLWMRMFPGGYQDLVAGWSKGFVSGADNTPKSALIGISFWLSGLIMGTMALNFLLIASELGKIAIAIFYLLCALQCLFLFRNAGTFRWYHALFFPVGLFFYQSVFFQALYRKKRGGTVEWKGRHVD
ncbi:MAG: glycosyltransferase [Verrucomicrobiota bacterium]